MGIMKQKKKGYISIKVLFAWLLLLLILLFMFTAEIYLINVKAEMTQDNILYSNLAAYKDIDLKALGDDPQVFKFSNPNAALETFKNYLAKNMSLDSNLIGINNSIAVGEVKIKQYIIYNIIGNGAVIYTLDINTNTFSSSTVNNITTSPVVSPSGAEIKKTSIYTKLEFDIAPLLQGIVGKTKTINVDLTTDITY